MSIQASVFDSLHFIVSLYTSEIIERQQFIVAHCYWLLLESFLDVNRFAQSTSHSEEKETN